MISILLAFAVDAAWDRAQDAAAERVALEDLRAELSQNVEAIDRGWLPGHIETAVATARVLRALHGIDGELPAPAAGGAGFYAWYVNNVVIPISELDGVRAEVTLPVSVVSSLTRTNTYGPSIASLDILIQAGGLASLTDASLRASLASLPADLIDLSDEELFARDLYYQGIRPYLVGVDNSLTVIDAMGDDFIGGVRVSERMSLQQVTLRGSVELSRALAKRLDVQVNVVANVRRLRSRFAEIVSHLSVNE